MSVFDSIARFLGVGSEAFLSAPAEGSLIGKGLTLKGEVTGEGDLVIAGRFEGEIVVNGSVQVEPGADVDANITATQIVIGGIVRGNLSAAGRVEILPTGALTGSLKTGSLSAVGGASLKGEVWVEPAARSASHGSP